ncbi:MAG: M23 family metallopeptidase [Thermoanaerobaculia bacterium]
MRAGKLQKWSGIAAAGVALVLLSSCGGADSPTAPPDCSEFPDQQTSPYVLPWSVGASYQAFLHLLRGNSVQRFAIDFTMPIGTTVVAARAGTVVRVEERYVDGDHTAGHENRIFLEHSDGTVARYVHLTRDGALVEVGELVAQGDPIALSGNTGNSSGPHTHFDVTSCCCITPPNYNELPCGQTLPLSFRNTQPHACGLEHGALYTAEPF